MTEWIISSSVLIVAVLLLRQLVRGKLDPRAQYALWALVLLRLLCPVNFFQSDLSIHHFRQTWPQTAIQQELQADHSAPSDSPQPEQQAPAAPSRASRYSKCPRRG